MLNGKADWEPWVTGRVPSEEIRVGFGGGVPELVIMRVRILEWFQFPVLLLMFLLLLSGINSRASQVVGLC